MGNVSTKETRSRSNTHSSGSSASYSETLSTRSGRRNTTTGVFPAHFGDSKKVKRQEEKERQRESHYSDLIVRFEENVDGGYLAPYGTYKSNLDYDTEVVRKLIVRRRLAPFYTPLQDFSDSWSDEELIIILSQASLHSIDSAYSEVEEEDDMDSHKIHKSQNFYKRQEQKAKLRSLLNRVKEIQKDEENKFYDEKLKAKSGTGDFLPDIPSKDLLLKLYRNASECPICFLYYPPHLNISRCCIQPICTECFVQIKRLDPHPPHDEISNQESSDALPHTLISEPAHCPYCAMPDFGVTYDPPSDFRCGIDGIKPSSYSLPFKPIPEHVNLENSSDVPVMEQRELLHVKHHPKRRMSMSSDNPGVITVDAIRPDWEQKLSSARNKLARKAATASAIHASNLIINQNQAESTTSTSRRASSTNRAGNNQSGAYNGHLQTMEDRMIEEALRLSLLDEEERRKKAGLGKQQKQECNSPRS